MKRSLVILAMLCSCFAHNGLGQSTDVLQYYIAYDVSGSLGRVDARHENIQHVLYKLTDYTPLAGEQYHPALQINLYAFGAGPEEVSGTFTYQGPDNLPSKSLSEVTQYNTTQRHSHLHTALESINKQLQDKPKESAGVFIFTDGLLQEGDIKSDLGTYRNLIANLLESIKAKVGHQNVFIIQTSSLRPAFQFVKEKSTPVLDYSVDSIGISRSYLWFSPLVDMRSAPYDQLIDRFIQEANVSIMAPPHLEVLDPVDAAISVAETSSYLDIVEKNDEIPEDIFKILEPLKQLDFLLREKDHLTIEDIRQIKSSLDRIANLNQVVEDTSGHKETADRTPITLTAADLQAFQQSADRLYRKYREVSLLDKKSGQPDTREPLVLSDAYFGVEQTPISEMARQARSWENLERDLILGLTDYLIKRSKQEVVYVFLEHLNDYVFERYTDLQLLFPAVFELTSSLDEEHPDILRIKHAVKSDIQNLPNTLYRYPGFVQHDAVAAMALFLRLYAELREQGSLEQSFSALNREISDPASAYQPLYEWLKSSQAGKSMIVGVRLIDYLVRNDLAKAYSDPARADRLDALSTMLFVLALDESEVEKVEGMREVRQQVKTIYRQYLDTRTQLERLRKLLVNQPTSDFDGYRKYQKELLMDVLQRVSTLLTSGMELTKYIKMVQTHSVTAVSTEVVAIGGSTPLGEHTKVGKQSTLDAHVLVGNHTVIRSKVTISSNVQIGDHVKIGRKAVIQEGVRIGDSSTIGRKAILSAGTVVAAGELIKKGTVTPAKPLALTADVSAERMVGSVKKGIDAWFNIQNENYVQAMFDLSDGLLAIFPDDTINRTIKKLVLASGEVASARSAEEISNIIAKHTLPVASYRIKRQKGASWMVTAYTGVSGSAILNGTFSTPLLATIGPEVTLGYGKGSFSLMATVLDVGNIVSYRFNTRSDSTQTRDVSFARILSPGVLLAWGFNRKLPVAITGSFMGNPWRFQLGVAMDLPLIRFK